MLVITYSEYLSLETPNHQVSVIEDNVGKFWVIGNTSIDHAIPLENYTDQIVFISRMDQPNHWTKVFSTREGVNYIKAN